jgi:DNA-binding NarL/FixJ family response regulator
MLLAPLIIVMASIARVISRIVRAVGQEKHADNHLRRTPPRKIRVRFRGTSTVKNHVGRILSKLGASDRTQAAIMAIEMDLISLSH